jgi:photosynthetic reaction center H subunit
MQPGAYLDFAQVTLYVFWIFFACLILYLRREDKREGYPLESTAMGGGIQQGFPSRPDDKVYLLRGGHTATLPNHKNDRRDVALAPVDRYPGSPYEPTGNPMLDGVGPGSWADREDVPELTMEDVPAIVPMRIIPATTLSTRDADPRGMPVLGADGEIGGTCVDVWVDRAESIVRYLEVEVQAAGGPKRVLLPLTFALIKGGLRNRILVDAILGAHFADVPVTRSPDQVTKLEEDRIVGYFGAGTLYAMPSRQEPLI